MDTENRIAARLLIFDDEGCVLLFRYSDSRGSEFWATPGGGVEPGESTEQAARREALEELEATQVHLSRLWTSEVEFEFANRRIFQTETFFLVTGHSGALHLKLSRAHRLEGITEMRWWSLDEIEKSAERIFPRDLAIKMRLRVPEIDR